MGDEAEDELSDDKGEVEEHADGECFVEIGRGVGVAVAVAVRMAMLMGMVMVVIVLVRHSDASMFRQNCGERKRGEVFDLESRVSTWPTNTFLTEVLTQRRKGRRGSQRITASVCEGDLDLIIACPAGRAERRALPNNKSRR